MRVVQDRELDMRLTSAPPHVLPLGVGYYRIVKIQGVWWGTPVLLADGSCLVRPGRAEKADHPALL